MPIERAIAFGLVVVSSILLVRLGPGALRSWRIDAGTGQRRQKDAAGRSLSAPPGVGDRVALLAETGYHRLGELGVGRVAP